MMRITGAGVVLAVCGIAMAGGEKCKQAAQAKAGRPNFVQVAGSPFQVGPMAGRPVTGDVNNDGVLDIVVACGACCGHKPDVKSGHVAVMLGDGAGGFRLAGKPTKIGPTALRVALADFNSDKKLDIACVEHDSYGVSVLLGDGTGKFSKAPGSPFVSREGGRPHTHDLATGDVNGDGLADVAVTYSNDNTVAVLLGDGRGGLKPAASSPVAAGRHPYEGLCFGDVNADGKTDLAVSNLMGSAVSVLTGDGKGGFAMASGSPVGVGERPGFVALGDLNADGRADLIATHDDVGMVDIMLADAEGRFTPTKSSPVRLEEPVWGAVVADLDGDGMGDVALAGMRGNVLLLRGDGAGNLGPEVVSLKAGDQPNYVVVSDFNKDGRLDVAASNYKSGDISVFVRE